MGTKHMVWKRYRDEARNCLRCNFVCLARASPGKALLFDPAVVCQATALRPALQPGKICLDKSRRSKFNISPSVCLGFDDRKSFSKCGAADVATP
jgi:hypothetical protein